MIRGGVVTLHVADVGRAVRFYIETLGLKLVEEAENISSAVLDAGDGFRIRLQQGTMKRTDFPIIELEPKVPIDECIAIYENRGMVFSITRSEHTTTARFEDIDGNVLSLTQTKSK